MIALYVKLIIVAGSIIAGLGSVYVLKMKQDNPVEEAAEKVIQKETGLDIDLTPQSPEQEKPTDSK